MDPDTWKRVKTVYHAVLDRAPGERAAFLEQTCKDEPAILQEVQSLLAQESNSFLERAAWEATQPRGEAAAASEPAAIEETPAEPPTKAAPARRHPFVWVVWLALAGLTAVFAYAAWKIPQDTVGFGWSEAQRGAQWQVAAVSPAGPAAGKLELGDVLVSLNGDENVGRAGAEIYRQSLKIGEQYRVRVRRGDATLAYELATAGRRPNVGYLVFYWVLSLVWCAIGLFIGFARPQDGMARLAFGAAALTGFVFVNGTLLPTLYALEPLHVVLGYHFFYRFPGQPPRARGWRWILWLLYLGTAVYVVRTLWIKCAWFTQGPRAVTALQAAPLQGALQWVFLATGLLAMIAAPVVAIHKYLALTDRDLRRRFQWVFLGGVVGLVPPAVQLALDPIRSNPAVAAWLLPGNWWLAFDVLVTACTVAIPLSVAYVVVKHGVFGIQVVIRRGLQYLFARRALQILLALPVGALLYTLVSYRHRTIAELAVETRGYLFWIAALGLSLRFRAPVLRWLDQKFFREQIDSEQVVLSLVDQIGRFDSAEQVSGFVCQQLDRSLHPKSMYLWWSRSGTMTLASSSDPGLERPSLPISGTFLERLKQQGSVTRVPLLADSGASTADARWLADKGVRLIVPMAGPERFEGLLMLGEKKSEEPYNTSDEHLVRAMVQATAMMLDNLQLKERVKDEQRIRHEVLAKLDHDLVNLMQECPVCGACYDHGAQSCDCDGNALTLTLPVARIIDDKYRLDRLIGRGGMGAVYAARDLRLEREVAVKVMLGGAFGHEAALRRFRREAQAVARLNHPNIVALYDFGELEGGGAYLVMERVHGVNLRAEMKRVGAFPPAEAAEWFEQMLDGLAAAHELGMVHRDFKPENILGARRPSGALAVKILDFGLAKIRPLTAASQAPQSLTQFGVVLGTLAYMAPEQLLGREVDARADVYAAGVVLVEMLTRERPFAEGAVLHADYRLPSGVPNHVALDAVVCRCLATEPRDRFPNAAELRAALVPTLRVCGSGAVGARDRA